MRRYQGSRSEGQTFWLTKLRIIEIAVALLLTVATLLFVGLTEWAAGRLHERAGEADVPNQSASNQR